MNKYIKSTLLLLVLFVGVGYVAMSEQPDPQPVTEAVEAIAVTETEAAAIPAADDMQEFTTMEEFQASPGYVKFMIDNLWVLIAAFLVLLMHLGFASLESGLTQSKNSVNVIYKNVFILCSGILLYALRRLSDHVSGRL